MRAQRPIYFSFFQLALAHRPNRWRPIFTFSAGAVYIFLFLLRVLFFIACLLLNLRDFYFPVLSLQRCREDGVLVEALPETLELLLRTCMEALHVAGDRAKAQAQAVAARSNRVRNPKVDVNGVSGNSGGASSSPGSPRLAVSELELARAVMTDSVYLAQLAPECFHEVVARVARKTEPERYGLMFPLHRTVEEDDQHGASTAATRAHLEGPQDNGERRGGGAGCKTSGVVGLGLSWGRLVHPTHLFHECVTAGRLTTAAWFLPLVRDDVAYDAARR